MAPAPSNASTAPGAVLEAFTLTLGDCAENEAGMQIIGTPAAHGVSVQRLQALQAHFQVVGVPCELVDLNAHLPPNEEAPEAAVLVLRGGVNALLGSSGAAALLLAELRAMPKDTTTFMYGRVVNKHARHNNTMADAAQPPDIARGRGTVVPFAAYPTTQALRAAVAELLGLPVPLVGELNHYFDAATCGIGWHGDAERMAVVGVRVGPGADGMPLKFHWYRKHARVGSEVRIELDAGDVYLMSEKAVGNDWKRPSILTLRHAAGKDTCKYARPPAPKKRKRACPWARVREKLRARAVALYWLGLTEHLMAPGGAAEARDREAYERDSDDPSALHLGDAVADA